MEIENLRAIYLPDIETEYGPCVYQIINSRDGLHWDPDTSNLPEGTDVSCASFDLPFIDEKWMIMQSVQEEDSEGNELFEMDVVETEGYYQKYFIVVRSGHSFVLFDGGSGILKDPEGIVWKSCKYVCSVWDSHKLNNFIGDVNLNKIINLKF